MREIPVLRLACLDFMDNISAAYNVRFPLLKGLEPNLIGYVV